MPKRRLPHDEAVRRFERKCELREAKAQAKAEAQAEFVRARKRDRQDAARLVRITHLRRALQDAVRRPSLFTAKRLGAIARNPELPAEARVEAARLLQQWLFAEPSELQVPNVGKRKRGRES